MAPLHAVGPSDEYQIPRRKTKQKSGCVMILGTRKWFYRKTNHQCTNVKSLQDQINLTQTKTHYVVTSASQSLIFILVYNAFTFTSAH